MSASAQGKFVWRTLLSQDVDAAKAFYKAVVGWKITEQTMGDITHAVAHAGEAMVADFVQNDRDDVPSHWMSYVAVPDLDKVNEMAPELGGNVMAGPIDIPDVGRFSVIQDPQGAVFWPFEGPADNPGPPDENGAAHGGWGWAELMTTDLEAAMPFYAKIVGWETRVADMPTGAYGLFKAQGQDRAGCMNIPEGADMPPAWTSYLTVSELAPALERAKKAGGSIVVQPITIPDLGVMAGVIDASGAFVMLAEWHM